MNKNMLGAMFVGAAIGATLGIILGTSKGKELRKQFTKKAGQLADQLAGTIEEGKSLLNDLQKKTSVKNKASQTSE